MNWNEYVALAIRTESVPQNWFSELPGLDTDDIDSEDRRQLNTSINTRATRLLHATMGICTELVELADGYGTVNFVEEVGDVLWYLAIADDVIDWRKCNRVCEPKSNLYWIGELNDAMKRHLFYGTELNVDKIVTACIAIYHGLVVALSDRQLLIEAAMEANIEKLSKRYPNKYFDKTDAVTRDVENELSHIDPQLAKWAAIRAGWGRLVDGEVIKPYHPDLSVKRSRKDLGKDILERLGCTEDELHQAIPNAEEYDVALFLDPAMGLTLQVFHQDADLTGNPFAGSVEIPVAETDVENELSHILGAEYVDKLVAEAKAKILTPTGFMEIVRSNLTNYQQIQALKSLAFMVADQLRKSGALAEARAYDAMYRDCTESAIEAGDISFYNLWVRLGFPSNTADEVREQLERWK